jgi:DMSO/TMAO reductase YedYZ molybdopterin-dependent catalytic subunit
MISRKILAAGLSGLAMAAAGPGSAWALNSTELTVTGNVATPGTYTAAVLATLTQSSVTATYNGPGGSVTDSYTGVSMWNLLNAAGGVVTNPAVKNEILRDVVVATGTDGYAAAFALGEIDPSFGNRPYLIATSDNLGQVGSGPDGFTRVVVPGDTAGGRYVSNLDNLNVVQAPTVPVSGTGGISSQFTLSGNVKTTETLTLAALQALPASTESATYKAGGTPVTDIYTGVSLWSLLNSDGLLTDPKIKNDILRDFVLVTGSDGYEAVISLGEIDPAFGDQPDLVAYADTLGQLGVGGVDGFARLVVPGDIAGGRYVSNIVSLAVIDATGVPEPLGWAMLLTMAAGLFGVSVVGRRGVRNPV